tara:strand:- start:501 stop:803 length:303 start_codon:yes stop_codon:yes gene_type:complete
MNNKNSRTNALPGLRKKNGPTSNPSVSDSVNRGKVNSNVRILSDKEVAEKNNKSKSKKYIPGVDGPKVIGGAVPFGGGKLGDIYNTAKGVYNVAKKILKR